MTSEGLLFTSFCGTGAADLPRCFSLCARLSAPPILVGYNSMEFNSDETTYFVGSFENISTKNVIKIGQIIPDENWSCWSSDMISTLNSLGAQVDNYTYNEGNWYVCDDAGIPEGDPIDETVELDLNAGILVYSNGGSQLQFAGAVPAGECELIITPGETTYTGNFTPAPLKIGDIVPDESWSCWSSDMISTVNNLGAQVENYTFNEGDWYVCDDAGIPEGDPINDDVIFQPNQGFIIFSNEGQSLTFPSPLK